MLFHLSRRRTASMTRFEAQDTGCTNRRQRLAMVESKAILPYFQAIGTFAFEATVTTLTITAKGQVSLRKEILRHLGAGPGDKIVVETLSGGRIEVRAARATGKISDAFGYLKREDGPSLSIEEINEIIAEGWARQS